jgi:hypothetical protein
MKLRDFEQSFALQGFRGALELLESEKSDATEL